MNEIQNYCELYQQGLTMQQIAQQKNATYRKVWQSLHKSSISLRKRGGRPGVGFTIEHRYKLSQALSGSNNSQWTGDNGTKLAGHLRARRLFGSISGFVKHHIDGNPLDNNPENIEFLTQREHLIRHDRLSKRDSCGRFVS